MIKKYFQKHKFNKENKTTNDNDYDLVIDYDCIAYDENDDILFVYKANNNVDRELIENTFQNIKFNKRLNRHFGVYTRTNLVGFSPPSRQKKQYCSVSLMAQKQPLEHDITCELSKIINNVYCEFSKEKYNQHDDLYKDKFSDFTRLENTVFTSGVINKNVAFQYHYDRGNLKNVFSGMFALKKNVFGGYLILPEYKIAIEIADCSIFLFDGQSIVHGVSPIEYQKGGYRYTVVFYTSSTAWRCLPIELELKNAKEIDTRLEKAKYKRMLNAI